VLPLARSQLDLSLQDFLDGLALQYKKLLLYVPSVCDGCRVQFSIEHALDYSFGVWLVVGTMRFEMHLVTLLL